MVDFSGFLPVISEAFTQWLQLFGAPFRNIDMLWIIVPIWGVWIFSEFFQEKKGTSFGNAITNGAVMLFVGVDWIRFIVRQVSSGASSWGRDTITEVGISVFIVLTSLIIVVLGIRGNRLVKLVGKARESTYLLLMFTPVIYGVVDFSFYIVAVMAGFFPLFYLVIELIDRVLPTPKTFDIEEDLKFDKDVSGSRLDDGLGSDFGQDLLGQKGTVGQGSPGIPPRQRQWSGTRQKVHGRK